MKRIVAAALAGSALLGPVAVAPTARAGPAAPAAASLAAPAELHPDAAVGTDRLAARGVQTQLPRGVPAPPDIPASTWLIADLRTGEVIAARNAHVPKAPASALKILTALALAPGLPDRTRYIGRPADMAIDGSKVGIVAGSTYTVADLLHGLMLGSGNDAAEALAQLSGGMAAATQLMTEEASRLQAVDTVVRNTSGLDAPGQVSSAYDLALFGRAALADPRLAKLVSTTRYRFPAQGRSLSAARERFEIQNHNRLLRNYPGATGVKNGYTVAAGGSFVGSATRGSRSYLVTLLQAEGRTWHHARDLLDWAFAYGNRAEPVGWLAEPLPEGQTATPSPAATGPADQPDQLHPGGVQAHAPGAGVQAGAGRAELGAMTAAGESARVREISLVAAAAVIAACVFAGLVLGLRTSRTARGPAHLARQPRGGRRRRGR